MIGVNPFDQLGVEAYKKNMFALLGKPGYDEGREAMECYVFEDSLNGVRSGMAAGCVTVIVPDLVPPPEGLAVSRVCASLWEAGKLIEKGFL